MLQQYPKRLIEVDLPIKRISAHARREKSIRHGHISTLHIWWARRPLAVCRAVLCAALWPDPADAECPVKFREDAIRLIGGFATKATSDKILKEHCSKEAWDKWQAFVKMGRSLDAKNPDHCNILRFALLDFIADFSDWDNSTVFEYLETARALTQSAHEALGGQPGTRPLVVDPFAGGGAIPLEALRVGADAFASDLNPLPILLNKVALEYVPRYGARLSEQVKQSAEQLRDGLQSNLKSYYFTEPKAENRVVFFWARCITCEGPGCGRVFPLIRSLWLRQKSTNGTAFRLKKGLRSQDVDVEIVTKVSASSVGQGTSRQGAATCPVCGYTTPVESVRRQLSQRRGGAADAKLLAVAYTRPG
jgi:putative DNA methylase